MPNKPEPLFVNGHYVYTLSSYDPVEVTLTRPCLTDDEVGIAAAALIAQHGWNSADMPTDAWIAQNIQGVNSFDELQQAVREELEAMNEQYVESGKAGLCAEKLAERLEQSVPAEAVQRSLDTLYQGIAMQAQDAGLSPEQAIASMGMTPEEFEHAMTHEAQGVAEQDAALDAIVDEYAIYVDETEVPELLGVSPKDAQSMIEDAKKHRDFDEMMAFCRRRKACAAVVRDAKYTYLQETAEQSAQRVAQLRAQIDAMSEAGGKGGDKGNDGGAQNGGHPHLELV